MIYTLTPSQRVSAWRKVWGASMTFHAVQLPSLNMTEYYWIYIDYATALGQMRLSQSGVGDDVRGVTTTVTVDLADLHSPYGSVHNRQKQQVGHRVALNALSTAYGSNFTNTGPTLKDVKAVAAGNITVLISTAGGGGGGAYFNGSHDCIKCCSESAFEVSTDGRTWVRVARSQPTVLGLDDGGSRVVQVALDTRTVVGASWVRYAYDALVQCPFFDSDGLPLGPFREHL